MNIAILGFGTVGSGVFEIIENKNISYIKDISVKKILVRNKSKITKSIMTDNYDEIVYDKEIDIIVEAMGGKNPAYEYIIKALNNHKHVVTSNKEVVAEYLEEFTNTAKANNVQFLYEASVGGGIPWIKSILNTKKVDNIQEVWGILNGTTNYILSNMYMKNSSFSETLSIAQEKGYAEANPSSDIDGIDVQRKLAITSSLCFNTKIKTQDICTFGIANIINDDISFLKSKGLVVKLIGYAKRYNNSYCAVVEPVLFKKDTIEANVNSNYNIGALVGDTIGDLKFYGQGAGKFATANAVVQDIIDIEKGNYIYDNISLTDVLQYDDTLIESNYYIRFSNENVLEIIKNYIDTQFFNGNDYYITTQKISMCKFQQLFREVSIKDKNLFYARYN